MSHPLVCPECLAHIGEPGVEACLGCGYVRPADGWRADPLIGLIVGGRYRLEGRLGAGGMATVFRASRLGALGGQVAVKVLAPRFSRTVVARRFEREAQVVSALQNPYIVRVYDFDTFTLPGEAQPLFYIAMELVTGSSLHEVLAKQGRVNVTWALDVLKQAARGLDEAHQKGITHRDLKPSNIMLVAQRESTHVKLLDFGIAGLHGELREGQEKLTQTGFVSGTPDYMAPEQAIGGEVGPEADIYALGVVAFEMLSGKRPFHGDSVMDTLMQRVTRPAPALREVVQGGEVPPELGRIIDRMLKTDPKERYPDAGALLDDLARFPALETRPDQPPMPQQPTTTGVSARERHLEELGSAPTMVPDAAGRPTPAPESATAPARRGGRVGLWVALGLIVVGGGVAAALIVTGDRGPDPAARGPAGTWASEADAGGAAGEPGATRGEASDAAERADAAVAATTAGSEDTATAQAEATALPGPRPALEAGYREVALDVAGGTLLVALPAEDVALFKPLPIRLGWDEGGAALRARSASVTMTLAQGDQAVGAARGEGRADGRAALELPPRPLAAPFKLAVDLELVNGVHKTAALVYDARDGSVGLARE